MNNGRNLVVSEVYADGHDRLTEEYLGYIRSMANRVGFTVIERESDLLPSVAMIELHIKMANPVFRVRLEEPPLP